VTQSSSNSVLWNRLLAIADTIDDPDAPVEELCAQLLAVEEGPGQGLDPADQYAEYTALLLCRALRRRLQREQTLHDQRLAASASSCRAHWPQPS
jgi:hypothetical protein